MVRAAEPECPALRTTKLNRLAPIGLVLLSVFAMAQARGNTPRLVWNVTPSVPTGLYWLANRQPRMGNLTAIRLPISSPYLPTGILLIKRTAARAGYIVCRRGTIVTINGRLAAVARIADGAGRPLKRWSGCMRLRATQTFVLSTHPDSFDSRYFGPVDRRHTLGTATQVFHRRP
jgi:type IV secretory pathway protease TraF